MELLAQELEEIGKTPDGTGNQVRADHYQGESVFGNGGNWRCRDWCRRWAAAGQVQWLSSLDKWWCNLLPPAI